MARRVVLLSVPALRACDLENMPHLRAAMARGQQAALVPSFPCVTWPAQVNMVTGVLPECHGVVANGFYWRDEHRVEMWTARNDRILAPQIWDRLHERSPELKSAVWFPMLSKGCGADYICMPAPVHNPGGSESLWCYSRPAELYGELLDAFGHFPLHNFWGPLAGIASSRWIAESAAWAARRWQPDFFFIYLPHLDYAAQRTGPDSQPAQTAVVELDETLGKLADQLREALGDNVLLLVATEYVITPVSHVLYPNRLLRESGLLDVQRSDAGDLIDFRGSSAWALADHQISHVFVRDRDPQLISRVAQVFTGQRGVSEVLAGEDRRKYAIAHERSGDVIVISTPESWQAYYWWLADDAAPSFARTVDIHRKPGYDPVELHVDRATRSIPLDANLVRGSHGLPATERCRQGVLLASESGVIRSSSLPDTGVFDLVMSQFI
jgi:hypothetical protein